jgi:hypothetical protein
LQPEQHMTVPDRPEPADDELLAYLLELLSAEDTERVELASITDDEVAARLRIVETDLVDGYVRGALTGATLAQFESRYMASARRRERVRRASAFVRAIDRAAAQADSTTPSVSVPYSASAGVGDTIPFRGSAWSTRPWSGLAAVAALLLLAGGASIFWNIHGSRGASIAALESTSRERAEVSQQPSTPRGSDPRSNTQLHTGAGDSHVTSTTPIPQTERSVAAPAIALSTLVLFPQTRGTDSPPSLVVEPGSARAALDLRLEPGRPLARYRARLKDPGTNAVVWRSAPLTATGGRDRAAVSVVIPVALLHRTHYAIELTDTRGSEIVESYTFSVNFR